MKRFWIALLLACAASPVLALTQAQIPSSFSIPWGASAGSAYIRSIPIPSQIGTQNCAASLTDGFPPLTFVPAVAGGCPPFGADFNGILKQITQWSQWQKAGGAVFYDSAFSAAIGGYPKGTVLSSGVTAGQYWLSTVDNNTSDPDTGGANWKNLQAVGGVLTGTLPNPGLAASGVSAGTYTRLKATFNAAGQATSASSGLAPTYTSLTTAGATGTYTPPAGVVSIKVRMGAGGGGGGGSGTGIGGSNGGNGGTSSLGGWTAVGGGGGILGAVGPGGTGGGGAGGSGGSGGSSGTGTQIYRLGGSIGAFGNTSGSAGGAGVPPQPGGAGASGPFGGGTVGGGAGLAPNAPLAGGNGGGGQMTAWGFAGGGGGAGEYVEFQIVSPGPMSYAVGARGTAGNSAGTNAGSVGGPGVILIEENYD